MKILIDYLNNQKLVKKYLYKNTWLSGCSTYVSPITCCETYIFLEWASDKNIFNKFIQKVVNENADLIESGYFSKGDGSCPSEIIFNFKKKIEIDT